jgi:hypothetical protein
MMCGDGEPDSKDYIVITYKDSRTQKIRVKDRNLFYEIINEFNPPRNNDISLDAD